MWRPIGCRKLLLITKEILDLYINCNRASELCAMKSFRIYLPISGFIAPLLHGPPPSELRQRRNTRTYMIRPKISITFIDWHIFYCIALTLTGSAIPWTVLKSWDYLIYRRLPAVPLFLSVYSQSLERYQLSSKLKLPLALSTRRRTATLQKKGVVATEESNKNSTETNFYLLLVHVAKLNQRMEVFNVFLKAFTLNSLWAQ